MALSCAACGTENPDGAVFCDNCGATLAGGEAEVRPSRPPASAGPREPVTSPSPAPQPAAGARICPSCGHENTASNNFCENCGTKLAPAAPQAPAPTPSPQPQPSAPLARLVVIGGAKQVGKEFPVGDSSLIGRTSPDEGIFPEVDLTELDPEYTSRRHAKIERRSDGYYLIHLSKTNPTLVNGQRHTQIDAAVPLPNGATVQVGKVEMRFET